MNRKTVTSGSPYESTVGFSRAVRTGDAIAVGGTAAIGLNGETIAPGDAAAQLRHCLQISVEAVESLGGAITDVTRTRVMLTDIDDWAACAAVHGEFFGDIRPTTTVMQVVRFIDPDWRVETEVDAVVSRKGDR